MQINEKIFNEIQFVFPSDVHNLDADQNDYDEIQDLIETYNYNGTTPIEDFMDIAANEVSIGIIREDSFLYDCLKYYALKTNHQFDIHPYSTFHSFGVNEYIFFAGQGYKEEEVNDALFNDTSGKTAKQFLEFINQPASIRK